MALIFSENRLALPRGDITNRPVVVADKGSFEESSNRLIKT